MGKQYNYYIDSLLEKKFCEHLFKNGYSLLSFYRNELVYYTDYKLLCTKASSLCIFFIYREEWGALASETDERLLREKSPIIVYRRPCINNERQSVSRGRLFVNTKYKNDIMNYDLVCNEFNYLVRWLKREIEYKEYQFQNGKKCLYPISQKAVELIENGYYLQS